MCSGACERERAPFGVLADRPALTRVDHRPAQLLDALECVGHGRFDLEVGQRPGITRPGSARVDAEPRRPARLPSLTLLAAPRLQFDAEKSLPEPLRTRGVIGW